MTLLGDAVGMARGTAEGVRHFVERQEMGLFSRQEYEAAFIASGLRVDYDPTGPFGRGLYVGCRPDDC